MRDSASQYRTGLAIALIAACHAAAPRPLPLPAEPPPVTEALDEPVVFGPVSGAADRFDEPIVPVTTDDPMWRAVAEHAGQNVTPGHDGRLDLAASELAAVVARGASVGDDLAQFALHAHGVVERGRVAVTHAGPDAGAALAGQLGDTLTFPNMRLGVGSSGDVVVAVAVLTVPIHFTSAPREVPAIAPADITFTLDGPYTAPRATATYADRLTRQLIVAGHADGYHVLFPCGGRAGEQWLAIEVAEVTGPIAIIPISCDGPPPPTFRVETDRSIAATTADPVRTITAMINRERAAAHVPLLVSDDRTQLAAARYAETMRAAKDVAHDLGNTEPSKRLRDAGRLPLLVSETTLHADDLRQATTILLDDPLYRAQVVAAAATHVGVGVTVSPTGEVYLAIEYISIPPIIDPPTVESEGVRQILAANRTRRTLAKTQDVVRSMPAPPAVDAELTLLARRYARDLAHGWSTTSINAAMRVPFIEAQMRFEGIGYRVVQIDDPAHMDVGTALEEDALVDNIGVGVAQSSRAGLLSGRIWLVVLYAGYKQ